ncbi:MAG: AraC-like DNA-binding protein [Dokdonia sp.]|jgi:AraC-like DNA-binding protein
MNASNCKLLFFLFVSIAFVFPNDGFCQTKTKTKEHQEFYNYIKWSENYGSQKQFDSANKYVERAIRYVSNGDTPDLLAIAHINKATILFWQARPNDAKPYLESNILTNQISDSIKIKTRLLYSRILTYQQSYKESLRHSIEAETILSSYKSLKKEDSLMFVHTYINIAIIHKLLGNFDTSITMYNKAIAYCNDPECKSTITYYKASVYNQDKQIDKAIARVKDALKIAQENSLQLYIPTYYLALSEYQLKLKNGDSTVYYAQQGLRNNMDCHIDGLNNVMGEGYIISKKYEKAIPFFEKALKAKNIEIDQAIVHKNLSDAYAKLGHYQKAIKENEIYLHLKDSLDALRMQQEVFEITERYESDKKQLEIEALSAKDNYNKEIIKEQKNRLTLITISLLVVTILMGLVWRLYIRQKKQDELLYQKNVQLAKKLKTLEIHTLANNTEWKREKEATTIQADKKQELLDSITLLISKNFYLDKEMSLSNMSKLMDTNTSYLSKLINESHGKSFANFLNELRISYTLKCLEADSTYRNLTIEYIADKSGFSSNSAFYKAFKKYTGLTPSYYIKRKIELV